MKRSWLNVIRKLFFIIIPDNLIACWSSKRIIFSNIISSFCTQEGQEDLFFNIRQCSHLHLLYYNNYCSSVTHNKWTSPFHMQYCNPSEMVNMLQILLRYYCQKHNLSSHNVLQFWFISYSILNDDIIIIWNHYSYLDVI